MYLNQLHPDRSSRLNLSANGSKGLTDQWRFLPSILQDKNSVLFLLKCMDGSVLAFLKSIDGSVLAFLKCTDGFIWTHLNGTWYGFVWSHIRFLTQSAPTRFAQSGNSGVPQLLCNKSDKTSQITLVNLELVQGFILEIKCIPNYLIGNTILEKFLDMVLQSKKLAENLAKLDFSIINLPIRPIQCLFFLHKPTITIKLIDKSL